MKRTVPVLCMSIMVMLVTPVMALDVGDKAPPLSIIKWVKGKPVSFPKDFGKKLYLVEFWATWCPPCKVSVPLLSRLQNKHRKDFNHHWYFRT